MPECAKKSIVLQPARMPDIVKLFETLELHVDGSKVFTSGTQGNGGEHQIRVAHWQSSPEVPGNIDILVGSVGEDLPYDLSSLRLVATVDAKAGQPVQTKADLVSATCLRMRFPGNCDIKFAASVRGTSKAPTDIYAQPPESGPLPVFPTEWEQGLFKRKIAPKV